MALPDVLDEFAAAQISPQINQQHTPQPTASGPGRPESEVKPPAKGQPPLGPHQESDRGDEHDSSDFSKQLEADMESMMHELQSNPEFSKHFGDMMAQLGGVELPFSLADTQPSEKLKDNKANAGEESTAPPPNFQDTIKQNMERLRQSSATADAASSAKNGRGDGDDDEMMSALFSELSKAGQNGNAGGDDSFSQMLLGMMEQLTNKDILYEPMKELDSKFPGWLAERSRASTLEVEPGIKGEKSNGDEDQAREAMKTSMSESDIKPLNLEDRQRYEQQSKLVHEIVARYERPGYTDDDSADREYIVERMQKMQAAGAPPPELVGDMGAAQEMMGDLEGGGCPVQ